MAWLYKQRDSNFWWIGWRANGKQFRRSTGKVDKSDAQKSLALFGAMSSAKDAGRLTDEMFESLTGKTLASVTLSAELKSWLDECKGATKPNTFTRYAGFAAEFKAGLGASDSSPLLRDVSSEQILSFLTAKRAKTSAGTTNLARKTLRAFFNRAVANGRLDKNPLAAIKPFKQGKDEVASRRAFTLEEIKSIYTKAPDDFWRYMILAGFYSGLRMGDLIGVVWGSVDFEENLLRLKSSKTGKAMQIPMRPALRVLLLDIRGKSGRVKNTDYVWPEQAEIYQESGSGPFSKEFYDSMLTPCGLVTARENNRAKKNGRGNRRQLNEVSFHCLRHTFVSMLKLTGATQSVAKELAGHSSDAVSDLYTHTPIPALKAAIAGLPEVV